MITVTMTSPDPIRAMETYRKTGQEVDRWFQAQQARRSSQMQCGKACTICCHGLFSIGIPDALELTLGIAMLEPEVRSQATERALGVAERIHDIEPSVGDVTLFPSSADSRLDRIVEGLDQVPCPLLDARGECVVYPHRPMACRVEGLPLVDVRDRLLGEWCELNFVEGGRAESFDDLTWDWSGVSNTEEATSDCLAESDSAIGHADAVTLIPTLLVAFETFWKPLLERLGLQVEAGADSQAGASTTTSS
jgi:Fe-S-cluster containining protein